jgi:hypothetical protein
MALADQPNRRFDCRQRNSSLPMLPGFASLNTTHERFPSSTASGDGLAQPGLSAAKSGGQALNGSWISPHDIATSIVAFLKLLFLGLASLGIVGVISH